MLGRVQRTLTVAATDDWIIEGGPSLTRAGPIAARAELIVWLDVPRLRRCWRILTRTIRYHRRTRPELPAGNVEAFNARSLRFLRKAWHTDAEVRRHLTQVSAVRPTLRLHGWNEADLWR